MRLLSRRVDDILGDVFEGEGEQRPPEAVRRLRLQEEWRCRKVGLL